MAKIRPITDPYGRVDDHNLPADGLYGDDQALKITVQDAANAEGWLSSHYFDIRWIEADLMYQSPPVLKTWEGTSIPRANVSRFTVATHVNALLAQIINGLFYEDPPFVLRPRPGTEQQTVRAIEAVTAEQLDETNFRQEVKRGLFSALLFGTAIFKWGWKVETIVDKKYERVAAPFEEKILGKTIRLATPRSNEFRVIETERECSSPYFESVDIRHCLVDPGNRTGDIRDSKFVIHRQALTYRDLVNLVAEQELLGEDSYDLPSEAEIKSWFESPAESEVPQGGDTGIAFSGSGPYLHHAEQRFTKTTEDPLDEPLEVLERWTNDSIVTVINKKLVIRNCRNPFGVLPFYSVNWWNIPDAFWGIGLGTLLSCEQRIQQGLTNAALDMASLIVNPLVVRSRGANITTQSIRQRLGGIVDVDGDPEKAFRYQEVPEIPGEIFAQSQQSEARSEAVSGANELLTMGNMPSKGRTSIGRTATGASALSSAASSRIGSFVEDFNRQVFTPWLWQMHELTCEMMPTEDLREILNKTLGQAYEVDEAQYLNASIKDFEVLAGSHLAVKQQMSQAIVLMSQLFQSPQIMSELATINGQYVDVGEMMHMISDMSGFKNYYSIVKPLTPEMKQQMQDNNPAVIAAKTKQQSQQQQQEHEKAMVEQKDIDRAVMLGMRPLIEKAVEQSANGGEAGAQGFGTNANGQV